MTGSLYGIRNVYKAVVRDDEWFTMNVARPQAARAGAAQRHAGGGLDRAARARCPRARPS